MNRPLAKMIAAGHELVSLLSVARSGAASIVLGKSLRNARECQLSC